MISTRNTVVLFLVLVGVLFLILKFFNLNLFKNEVCPPDQCVYTSDDSQIDKINSLAFQLEPGRIHEDFAPDLPPGFPNDLPIDPNPSSVLESYLETAEGDKDEGELRHTQLTYIYTTSQPSSVAAVDFEKYFKEKGYDLAKSEVGYNLSARKETLLLNKSITVSIVRRNQIEWLVTISIIVAEKVQNQ